jgi:hypothetical protein
MTGVQQRTTTPPNSVATNRLKTGDVTTRTGEETNRENFEDVGVLQQSRLGQGGDLLLELLLDLGGVFQRGFAVEKTVIGGMRLGIEATMDGFRAAASQQLQFGESTFLDSGDRRC